MGIPKLPSYEDDEVRVFHPFFEEAVKEALRRMGLDSQVDVVHLHRAGDREMDFALVRPDAHTYLLVVEIKRQPQHVNSARYQDQAKAYIEKVIQSRRAERNYYALTNLEILNLFKYDPQNIRVTPLSQMVEPSPVTVGKLEEYKERPAEFFARLVEKLCEVLHIVWEDSGEYKDFTTLLSELLDTYRQQPGPWQWVLAVAGYEYAKGVFRSAGRAVHEWPDATRFRREPWRLLEAGQKIDFRELFSLPPERPHDWECCWTPAFLGEMREWGRTLGTGDALAEAAHRVAVSGREHEGLVGTDPELARALACLVRYVLGDGGIGEGEKVCDPAAGSGTLISNIVTSFPEIRAEQLWANDKEPLFKGLLALRLGLLFPEVLSKDSAPLVTCKDLLSMGREDFRGVRVVLLNPPYRSGISVPEEKKRFEIRIRKVTSRPSVTSVGQAGIEAPFTELVTGLVDEGTVMGVILPKQLLTSNGREARAFREFLLGDFGLVLVFVYPRTGLFENVVKVTAGFVGKKGDARNTVEVVVASEPLDRIDVVKLAKALRRQCDPPYGVEIRRFTREELSTRVDHGWRFLTLTGEKGEKWVDGPLKQVYTSRLTDHFGVRRGGVGNTGGSDFVFIDSVPDLWERLKDKVPSEWLSKGIRRADQLTRPVAANTDLPVKVLCPPRDVFRETGYRYTLLSEIVDDYLTYEGTRKSKQKQPKKKMTKDRLVKVLRETVSRPTGPGPVVLVPRNIRRYARAFLVTGEGSFFVSTNFLIVWSKDAGHKERDSWLLLAWLLSTFGQVQFEVIAKDQEGARKIERYHLDRILIPDFSKIPSDRVRYFQESVCNTGFRDLCSWERAELDILWAEFLWPGDATALERLGQAEELLAELVFERNPKGNEEEEEEGHD